MELQWVWGVAVRRQIKIDAAVGWYGPAPWRDAR
jgi:hypothetical protein